MAYRDFRVDSLNEVGMGHTCAHDGSPEIFDLCSNHSDQMAGRVYWPTFQAFSNEAFGNPVSPKTQLFENRLLPFPDFGNKRAPIFSVVSSVDPLGLFQSPPVQRMRDDVFCHSLGGD